MASVALKGKAGGGGFIGGVRIGFEESKMWLWYYQPGGGELEGGVGTGSDKPLQVESQTAGIGAVGDCKEGVKSSSHC